MASQGEWNALFLEEPVDQQQQEGAGRRRSILAIFSPRRFPVKFNSRKLYSNGTYLSPLCLVWAPVAAASGRDRLLWLRSGRPQRGLLHGVAVSNELNQVPFIYTYLLLMPRPTSLDPAGNTRSNPPRATPVVGGNRIPSAPGAAGTSVWPLCDRWIAGRTGCPDQTPD